SLEPLHVRHQRREDNAGSALDLRHHLGGVGHLGDPPGRHERGRLDALHARVHHRVNQPHLVVAREELRLVLQPIARADLVDERLHALAGMFCRIHATMSCVDEPGVKISDTPCSLSLGMSSSGMMPPPNTRMSFACCSSSSAMTAGNSVMCAPDMIE